MKRLYNICIETLLIVLLVIIAIVFITGTVKFSSDISGYYGLIAIIPATIWAFLRGLNIGNIALYVNGLMFMLYEKGMNIGLLLAFVVAELIICGFIWIKYIRRRNIDKQMKGEV